MPSENHQIAVEIPQLKKPAAVKVAVSKSNPTRDARVASKFVIALSCAR
jgi:hypothetical protein